MHDPTQLNRQGPDAGTSYRSAIFFATPKQEHIARAYIDQLNAAHVFPAKIVTGSNAIAGLLPRRGPLPGLRHAQSQQPYILTCDVPEIAARKIEYPDLFVAYKGK